MQLGLFLMRKFSSYQRACNTTACNMARLTRIRGIELDERITINEWSVEDLRKRVIQRHN